MLINMENLLSVANEHKFAVPAFNISSLPMLKGVIDTCEKENSPVIIAIHPDELAYVGDSFVETIKDMAQDTNIPVVLHLDHGSTIEQILRAIRDGFTSVMIDASLMDIEDNIEITKKVVSIAHPLKVSVEAELGTIGDIGDEGDTEGGTEDIIFTQPEDCEYFIEETDVDSLAIAIGTAHGIYPEGFDPHLKLDLLSEIKESVSIPLVLHGGSSNPDEEIAEAVKIGINKINISSDIKSAFFKECRKILENEHVREPNVIYPRCIGKMNEVVTEKVTLFNSKDKVKYYR